MNVNLSKPLRLAETHNGVIEPPKFMSPRILQESLGDIDEDFNELDLELQQIDSERNRVSPQGPR